LSNRTYLDNAKLRKEINRRDMKEPKEKGGNLSNKFCKRQDAKEGHILVYYFLAD
jgi:hypothetical protein